MDLSPLAREVARAFEESWSKVAGKPCRNGLLPAWCSEADVKALLARELAGRLTDSRVYVELPIPIDTELFFTSLFTRRALLVERGQVKPDIAVIGRDAPTLILMAKVKLRPVYWGYAALLPVVVAKAQELEWVDEEFLESAKICLRRDIWRLEKWEETGPYSEELQYYLEGVGEFIKALKYLQVKEGTPIAGYLCVIDEVHPDIEEALRKRVKELDPPVHFKVLAKYHPAKQRLKELVKQLNLLG